MKFKVDYNTWRHSGNDRGPTYLLNEYSYMCCLGHCIISSGVDPDLIKDVARPGMLLGPLKSKLASQGIFLEWFGYTIYETHLTCKAVKINDDPDISTKERIQKLKQLFDQYGHEIEFINVPENVV